MPRVRPLLRMGSYTKAMRACILRLAVLNNVAARHDFLSTWSFGQREERFAKFGYGALVGGID